MATLTVHVVNDDDEPVSGANVFLSIHHRFGNDTWLEDRTDDDGEVEFDLDGFYTVDISVNGSVEEEDINAGQTDKDITISI